MTTRIEKAIRRVQEAQAAVEMAERELRAARRAYELTLRYDELYEQLRTADVIAVSQNGEC